MFKIRDIIRGDGKGYIYLVCDEAIPKKVGFCLTIELHNGNSIQGEIVELDNDSLVLVFPIIEQPLILLLSTKSEFDCILFKKRISPTLLKWKSRINYRLKKIVSRNIRDAEELNYFSNRSIKITNIVSDGKDDVVRGIVSTPSLKSSQLNLKVYDSAFNLIESKPLLMGVRLKPIKGISAAFIEEKSFSLRIPASCQPCIIVASGGDGVGGSFACISKELRDGLIKKYHKDTEHAQLSTYYQEWLKCNGLSHKDLLIQKAGKFEYQPLISIVTPVFNTPKSFLMEMLESVVNQTYSNWEHVLVNASPDNAEVVSVLESYSRRDNRFKVVNISENRGITLNTKTGIDNSKGEFIAFLDHDDILQPNALYEYVSAINNDPSIDLLYSDEDKIMDGRRCDPYFKPDFSLFLLREINYICHFLMIRRSLLDLISFDDPTFDGAQDHNMILQCIEKTKSICHISKVLYTWRISAGSTASGTEAKPYANAAGKLAIEQHLKRMRIQGLVEDTCDNCRYHVRYGVSGRPKVSIIIPNKDNPALLDVCIKSILDTTTYQNYEIIIVENNSETEEVFGKYKELGALDSKVKVVEWPRSGFNFSEICNFGEESSSGDYLLFLNNDTEVITGDWIEVMLGICQQPEVGAVGVKLLYPDRLIQHAGVYVQGDGAGHLALNLPQHERGYFSTVRTTRELSAVTAACMMVDRIIFEKVHGFDPEYAVAFNDIDLCMKIRAAGKSVVYSPLVELIHYESISRGYEDSLEKTLRFNKEASLLRHKWSDQYVLGDPYMNGNLNNNSGYYSL